MSDLRNKILSRILAMLLCIPCSIAALCLAALHHYVGAAMLLVICMAFAASFGVLTEQIYQLRQGGGES